MDLSLESRKSYPAVLFERLCDELKGCTDTLERSNQDIIAFVDSFESNIRNATSSRCRRDETIERRLRTRTENEEKMQRLHSEIEAYERRAAQQIEELRDSRLAAKLAVSLTGAKLDSCYGQYVGVVSCKGSGKYKLVEYSEDDVDLSDKLWSDVEQVTS